jgi:hypothetical protein
MRKLKLSLIILFLFIATIAYAVLPVTTIHTGMWCWFNQLRAVRYVGTYDKTYTATVDNSGYQVISSINNLTGATTSFTLSTSIAKDDHNTPNLLILPSGKILAVYSGHVATTILGRISTNAEDISAWGAEFTLVSVSGDGTGFTYPKAVMLSSESNKIYVFFRENTSAGGRYQSYVTSEDSGATWSARSRMYDSYYNSIMEWGYIQLASNNTDTIHFTHSGHPISDAMTSTYYFKYYNGKLYKSDGTEIGNIPTGTASAITNDQITLVYNGSTTKSWIWDIALSPAGYPVIAFATFPTANPANSDHRYNVATWNGSSWTVDLDILGGTAGGSFETDGDQPWYSGGIGIDKLDTTSVYVSRLVGSYFEIQKWTKNGTWAKTKDITTGSSVNNLRPYSPLNYASRLPVIWSQTASYPNYWNYTSNMVHTQFLPTVRTDTGATIRTDVGATIRYE